MRAILQVFLLSFVFQSYPLAQTKIQRHLALLDEERFEAMVDKNIGFLQDVLSDDLVYTHSNGLVETKSEHLKNIESGTLMYKTMQTEATEVKVFGKTAVLTGYMKVRGVLKGKEFDMRLRYTDVYIRRQGKWRLVAWQSLRVDP